MPTAVSSNTVLRDGSQQTYASARGARDITNEANHMRELRISVPVERGQLLPFAKSLGEIVRNERGTASLWVPANWL